MPGGRCPAIIVPTTNQFFLPVAHGRICCSSEVVGDRQGRIVQVALERQHCFRL